MVLSFPSKGNLVRLIQLRVGLAHVTDFFLGIEKVSLEMTGIGNYIVTITTATI